MAPETSETGTKDKSSLKTEAVRFETKTAPLLISIITRTMRDVAPAMRMFVHGIKSYTAESSQGRNDDFQVMAPGIPGMPTSTATAKKNISATQHGQCQRKAVSREKNGFVSNYRYCCIFATRKRTHSDLTTVFKTQSKGTSTDTMNIRSIYKGCNDCSNTQKQPKKRAFDTTPQEQTRGDIYMLSSTGRCFLSLTRVSCTHS